MEDRIKEILKELEQELRDNSVEFLFCSRRHFAHILYDALPGHEQDDMENTRIGEYIQKRNDKIAQVELRKMKDLNRPIEEVLSDFADKKSGKRQKARQELCYRFFRSGLESADEYITGYGRSRDLGRSDLGGVCGQWPLQTSAFPNHP